MSDLSPPASQSVFEPQITRALVSGVLIFGVALVFILLGLRSAVAVQSAGFLAVGVSIGTTIFVLTGLSLYRIAQQKSQVAVFQDLYGTAEVPAFLSLGGGQICAANASALDVLGGPPADRLATVLGALMPDPEMVFKVLEAAASRSAEQLVWDVNHRDGPLQLTMSRFGGSATLWRFKERPGDMKEVDPLAEEAPLALFELDKAQKISAPNSLAVKLGFEAGLTVETVLEKPFQQGALYVFGKNDQRFRGHIFKDGTGRASAYFIPTDPKELSHATVGQILQMVPVPLARVSAAGSIIHINEAARALLGEGAEPGARLKDHLEGLARSMDERIHDMMAGRVHMRTEVARCQRNGHETFLQVTLERVRLDGEPSILVIMNDATEIKTMEAQFVQAHKMAAVGQLAGGVAHDFNNLLTAINGHCDLILMRHETTDPDYGDLIQIRHNANRAASLVGQLLAFSRKQTLQPKVIDPYDTLTDLNHLLNRLLGEKVTLRINHGDNLPRVRVDQRQLEQVIMNLVVNARDAMPNGGEVLIETHHKEFENDTKIGRVVVPFGDYVQIDVTDTGVGIPPDKISKIFEPFFTTKGVGEGTGLGLSTAYGIIKQTGGFIFAESEVGAGTTFTIYLPAHGDLQSDHSADPQVQEVPSDLTGRGSVLLVEDEVPVRSFAARALDIRGYTVTEAGSAEEALEILEDESLTFDLFVSDVVMPGMDGPTWVKLAQEKRPDVKVVFVSGYAEDVFRNGEITVPNASFLPKPFSLNELTQAVKEQMQTRH